MITSHWVCARVTDRCAMVNDTSYTWGSGTSVRSLPGFVACTDLLEVFLVIVVA